MNYRRWLAKTAKETATPKNESRIWNRETYSCSRRSNSNRGVSVNSKLN